MSLNTSAPNPRTVIFFAPLAVSAIVLLSTLYISTHPEPGPQFADLPNNPTALTAPADPRGSELAQFGALDDSGERKSESGEGFTPADFARHVDALKKKLPGRQFTILVQPPFVVIGDGTPAAVQSQAATVKWAVDKLKQDFFEKDPVEILDIWLFKNEASYRKHALALFNDDPDTPYGYYSSAHKALVMNIGTGGGTLVHEIVHPFIESNFPECPAWLNEGLGSLYEQSGEQDGHIYGYVNWRLSGLQSAIKAGDVPPFKTLMEASVNVFYNEDKGTNYGQARYLCYYLQSKGLLVKFYKEFYSRRKADPSGYQTLQSILNEPDMAAFQKKWEKFVLDLREEVTLTVS